MGINKKRRERIIMGMKMVINHHNSTCPEPAKLIIMHPKDWEDANLSEIDGVLIGPDPRARQGFFRVLCEASGWELEQALNELSKEGLKEKQEEMQTV